MDSLQSYEEIWATRPEDYRGTVIFSQLSVEDERYLITEIMDFAGYYIRHKAEIDKKLPSYSGIPPLFYLIEFWKKHKATPSKVLELLSDFKTATECLSYMEKNLRLFTIFGCQFENVKKYEI